MRWSLSQLLHSRCDLTVASHTPPCLCPDNDSTSTISSRSLRQSYSAASRLDRGTILDQYQPRALAGFDTLQTTALRRCLFHTKRIVVRDNAVNGLRCAI